MTRATPTAHDELAVRLTELRRTDLAVAGGKGANLGELIAAGFPVPPGFVVTTAGYLEATEPLDLEAMLEKTDVAAAAASIREAITALPVPTAVEAAIRAAYRELGEVAVAVRSSATAEDLPGAAFAGQQDTYLNIIGADAVVDAVRDCWASLWTDRAISYRARQGIAPGDVSIAVVVQCMVEADYAGVLFTANPVTGDRTQTVIDASPGLGEAVVGGLVTPDHYVLDEHGSVIERKPGKREVIVRYRAGGGVEHDDSADRAMAELEDAALVKLSRLGTDIGRLFDRPQDIEWALAGQTAWIVQSRPLTALPPQPLRVNPVRRLIGSIFSELLPIRPYPLDMSTWTVHGHGRILTRMVAEIPAVRIRITDLLPEPHGVVEQLIPANPRPSWRTLTTPFRMRERIRRFEPARWTEDDRFARFEQEVDELRAMDVATLPWPQLLEVPRQALATLDRFIDIRIDYLPRVGVDLVRLKLLLAVLGLRGENAALMRGGDTTTQQANRALAAITDVVRANPAWASAFQSREPVELLETVRTDNAFGPLRGAIDSFLDRYGHRETTSPFLMSQPTWSDDPDILVGSIRAMIAGAATGQQDAPEPPSEHVRGLRRVRFTRTGPAILRAAAAARAGVAFREDSHFHAMRPLPVLRAALLDAGRRLHKAGLLERPADVLHLRLEELEDVADPGAIDAELAERLRAQVVARSDRRDELAGAPLISPATLYRAHKRDDGLLATGIPARSGTVTGTVRVIRGPAEFGQLEPGEILVCPYTNPAWTPLFQTAAAVVVDSGGIASHAAIVAREYGIPAIMATGTGSTVLRTGQRVTVDGGSGQVRAA